MKKIIGLIFCSLLMLNTFANEWKFTSSIALQESALSKPVVSSSASENHFAKITEISVPIPVGQFVAQYVIPVDLGDSIVVQGANVTFIAGPIITPVTFENQVGIVFTPSPILNVSLGGTIGTGWDLLGNHGFAKYDFISDSYKPYTPFADWKYSLIGQANFQFDFGAVIPGEWTHVITTANYTVSYDGIIGAAAYEPWMWQTQEYVNGLTYSANALLGYQFPWKMKMIAFAVNWHGHFDGADYGVFSESYDGDFVEINLAAQMLYEISEKSQLVLSVSVPSRRAYSEAYEDGKPNVSKKAAGREWFFNGITLQWVYTF